MTMFLKGTNISVRDSSLSERGVMVNMRAELVKRRLQLGLTHDQVAEKSGISRAYYSNIEAERKDPSLKVMKRISETLKIKVDTVFFSHDVPKGNLNGMSSSKVHGA